MKMTTITGGHLFTFKGLTKGIISNVNKKYKFSSNSWLDD